MYSYSLDPENYQPKGSCNFSKIDDSYLKLTFNKIINYQNSVNIKAYGLYFNILTIKDGMCALKYAT